MCVCGDFASDFFSNGDLIKVGSVISGKFSNGDKYFQMVCDPRISVGSGEV
jgi:hypothetical protein